MKKTSGYSLMEVMVGMFVFSLVALGITATVIQSQKISQSNLFRNAAYTIVQGYLEQVKTMSTTDLAAALAEPVSVPLATLSVTSMTAQIEAGDLETADPLFLNVSNAKQVLVNIDDPAASTPVYYYMNIEITPSIVDMNDSAFGADAIPAYEIKLDFNYEVRHKKGVATHAGSLRTIVANI